LNKCNLKSSFLLILIFSSLFTPFICSNIKSFKTTDINIIKTAGSWIISPIVIDGYDPLKNWAYFASLYPWCYGSGTENDPYIIENVTINGGGSGDLITVEDTLEYFVIQNCHLYNGEHGIGLEHVENGKLINNNIHSNLYSGISIRYCDYIGILNNSITNNGGSGIYLYGDHIDIAGNNCTLNNSGMFIDDSSDVNVLSNIFSDNLEYGIILRGQDCEINNNVIERNGYPGIYIDSLGENNNISNNFLDGNEIGVELHSSSNNIISNNTVRNSIGSGMIIGGGANRVIGNLITDNIHGITIEGGGNIIEKNKIVHNNARGIELLGSDNTIYYNNISFNSYGIYTSGLYGIDAARIRNNISNNEISYNTYSGIDINYGFHNNTIYNNSIRSNGKYGIYAFWPYDVQCRYNVIAENLIYDNYYSGIALYRYDNNYILGNNISGNHNSGIYFYQYCDWNYISGNFIYDNYQQGIEIYYSCDRNGIDNNTIYKNRNIGILISWNDYNNFTNNFIIENLNYGVVIDNSNSYYNIFAGNNFTGNGIHAIDSSIFNYWNSSTIGNYWDDNFPNTDLNDDGIGETPYVISLVPLIQDYLPIFDDGDDPAPPIISIIFPSDYQITGKASPTFQISIKGLHVHTRWYELVGADQNVTFTENSEKIDPSLWDSFSNGTVTIRFYVNDTLGYGTLDEVTVRKDIYEPELTINSPISDSLFDNTAPLFNVEISDPNLDQMWYTIDGGLNNFTFITNDTIDQSAWDLASDGDITIYFYAIDAGDNVIFDSVTVRKDTIAPIISINSPNQYDLHGKTPLSFNVQIFELNLEKMWYTIQGASMNITFTSNSTLNPALWDSFGNGDLTLIFYANDSHGRITFESVNITKDIDPPTLSILKPSLGETFYISPPEYEFTVTDPNLESIWYTLDGGITNTTITLNSGSISQSIWDAIPIGEVTIRFYANDSVENIGFAEIVVTKASVSPNQPDQGIPGYDTFIIIGFVSITTIIVVLKRYKNSQ